MQKLSDATLITDFNSAIQTGLYKANPGTTNQPYNDYNTVYVWAYNNTGADVTQLSIGLNNSLVYFRTRSANTWTNWVGLASKNDSITKNDLIVKRFVSPAGGQTTSIVTNGIDAFFIYAIYRTSGSDQRAEGTALIKIYNNTAILTRKAGMEGFDVSYSNGTLSVTIPGYCSGGIIACAT